MKFYVYVCTYSSSWIACFLKYFSWFLAINICLDFSLLRIFNECVCMRVCVCARTCSVTSIMSVSMRPHELQPTRLLCPWNSPGKNTAMGCHALLQGIFPIQVSNSHLLHCRWIPYPLSHLRSPKQTYYCLFYKKYIIWINVNIPPRGFNLLFLHSNFQPQLFLEISL